MDLAEMIRQYVRLSADRGRGGRLLAWEGLADDGQDDGEESRERNARLRQEVAVLREHQRAGRLDDSFDPAALMLIAMSAGNALAVYPQLARGLFGADVEPSEIVEHYAEQLAKLIALAGGTAEAGRNSNGRAGLSSSACFESKALCSSPHLLCFEVEAH